MQMRFLVTSLIRLSIVRINYLMFPLMNRPRWDPPNLLRGLQNPLWSPLTTSAVLIGFNMNLPYFSRPSPSPLKHFRTHIVSFNSNPLWPSPFDMIDSHTMMMDGQMDGQVRLSRPMTRPWAYQAHSEHQAHSAYQAHAAMSKLDRPMVFRNKTVHFSAFKKKQVNNGQTTDDPSGVLMDGQYLI